jgi:hypothetical protein
VIGHPSSPEYPTAQSQRTAHAGVGYLGDLGWGTNRVKVSGERGSDGYLAGKGANCSQVGPDFSWQVHRERKRPYAQSAGTVHTVCACGCGWVEGDDCCVLRR